MTVRTLPRDPPGEGGPRPSFKIVFSATRIRTRDNSNMIKCSWEACVVFLIFGRKGMKLLNHMQEVFCLSKEHSTFVLIGSNEVSIKC